MEVEQKCLIYHNSVQEKGRSLSLCVLLFSIFCGGHCVSSYLFNVIRNKGNNETVHKVGKSKLQSGWRDERREKQMGKDSGKVMTWEEMAERQ